MNLRDRIAGYFEFARHNTSLTTEALAGVSTFLALAYIFVVNPAILAEGGFNRSAVLFATIIVSAGMTLLMGLWAKKPLVLAPGLEINAYVAFYVIGQLGFVWTQALGAVFWSGVIFLLLTLSGIRMRIIRAIPDRMKTSLALCVGVFLMLIALRVSGAITYEGIRLAGVGKLLSPATEILVAGFVALLLLRRFKIRGAVLLSIIGAALLANQVGLGTTAKEGVQISPDMLGAIGKLDVGVILDPRMWNVILVLFLVDFYGNVAKLIGLTRNTTIVNKDGTMPQMKEALVVDGLGAIGGSLVGTTSVLTYVESAVGIGEGGRTGLTAVVAAVLMLLFIVLTPLVSLVPVIATTGALLWVGMSLFPSRKELADYNKVELLTMLAMIATVAYTFAIDKALLVGFLVYLTGLVLSGRKDEINAYMVVSTLLLAIGAILQVL